MNLIERRSKLIDSMLYEERAIKTMYLGVAETDEKWSAGLRKFSK
ncbi:hypothetical protein ACNF42_06375 [Cuniculiplasma sp. SKW3]